MKHLVLFLSLCLVLVGCKKEVQIPETLSSDTLDQTTLEQDSLNFQEKLKADSLATLQNEATVQGQLQFTADSKVILKYDLQARKGETYVDGKTYELTTMVFAENAYQFSGPEIEVLAENGSFSEMTTDCLYGMLPIVRLEVNGAVKQFENVGVQHCPVNL